ncbi:MAG TPA: phosphate signaling complex protein PhoU [Steroidobacteraceae bacterium]|jgi:phosphate transport system protein|nr:phosphate signaling complex protein PhoU [Steroidobacteraceae bacterium]
MNRLEGHLSRAMDGALGALHLHVIAMGSLAVDQIRHATRAYTQWDAATAERVIEREQAIDAYDEALDEEQLVLLALRQPMASDLRLVIAFSRAVGELERVGDEAKKIARVVVADSGPPEAATVREIAELGARAEDLLRRSLAAFDALDAAQAAPVIAEDEQLDAQYLRSLEELLARPATDAEHFRHAVHAAFVMKSLERVGDHARNLARLLQP